VVSLEANAGETGIDPEDPSEYVKPGAELGRTEDERQLHAAIARLSTEHREVLILKDLEGMKYEEIAEVLAVPIGTIRSRLHRARLELRDLLVPLEERGDVQEEARGDDTAEAERAETKPPTPTSPAQRVD
jgi:RNA polymerase sigma-70 factor (ECF subfamily)